MAMTPMTSPAPPRKRTLSRRATFLIWLRRIHLWVGLWGAGLGLLFGATGILLNHRAILKLPVEKVVARTTQLALPQGRPLHAPEALARWLEAELQFDAQQTRIKAEPAGVVVWGGREVDQPERWTVHLHAPQRGVTAEYVVGNRFVKVDIQDATPIGTLTRLHMATGVSAFWVLLSDTIAGSLIVLSVTGLLLWSRMHPVKLSSAGVALTALTGAVWFLWHAV